MNLKLITFLFIPFLIFSCISGNKKETTVKVNNKDGIILRSLPRTNSYKLALIPYNSEIIVLDKNGPKDYINSIEANWYRVEFNNTHGYIFAGFLDEPLEKNEKNIMVKINPEIIKGEEKIFYFNHLDKSCKIDPSGDLFFESDKTNIKLFSDIQSIKKLFYYNLDNDIILLYEIDADVSGWSKLMRIRYNNNTIKKIFDLEVGHFNLTNGIVEDHFIYFATLGLIAKIDIDTGSFVWKHNDLDKNGQFNSFDDIIIQNDKIYFIEGGHNRNRKKIEVNKIDGKIENIYNLF